MSDLDLEQLRKHAKERVRAVRQRGETITLATAQFQLAREHGFASWPRLQAHLRRRRAEQPFRTDLDYYEGRAGGIATTHGISLPAARLELAQRHGFRTWAQLARHVEELRSGAEPATPFMAAYQALEHGDTASLERLLDGNPELLAMRGTNGNDLFGMARDEAVIQLLLERGVDVDRGNDYGWTKLHQAAYGNNVRLIQALLEAGARTDVSARGDGGTPLVVALFWGNVEAAALLGHTPRNLRVAAGLGRVDWLQELAGTADAGAHRGFYRPHGGFPVWDSTGSPQELLDEALVWAAKSDRVEALTALVDLGARVAADPYRGTALIWAAACGRVGAIARLVELGADPNQRATFGGPTHGQNVTALHLAAQAGQEAAVAALLEAGADPTLRDALYDGDAAGWAEHGAHPDLAARLRDGHAT